VTGAAQAAFLRRLERTYSSTTAFAVSWQRPQHMPTGSRDCTSHSDEAPRSTASCIWRSVTALQTHTYIIAPV
jgi:hypothetical protein